MHSPQHRRYDGSRVTARAGGRGDLSPLRGGKGRDAQDYLRDEWRHEPSYHRRRSPSPLVQERRMRATPPTSDRGESYVYTSSRELDNRKQQIQAQVQTVSYQSLSRGSLHHPAPGHDIIHQPALRYTDEDAIHVGQHDFQEKRLIWKLPADEHSGLARPLRIRDTHPVDEGHVLVSSGMEVGGKRMFVRGSGYTDEVDISARTFSSLRPEPGSIQHTGPNGFIPSNTGGTAVGSTSRYGVYTDEDLLHQNRTRDMYRGVDNEQIRYRDAPYLAEVPPAQPRQLSGASYVGLPEDNIPPTYQEAPQFERNVTRNITSYRDEAVPYDEYSQSQQSNPVHTQMLSQMVRKDTEDRIYSDVVRGDRILNVHNQISRHPQEDYSYKEVFHTSYRDSLAEASPEAIRKMDYRDHRASFQEDPEYATRKMDYRDQRISLQEDPEYATRKIEYRDRHALFQDDPEYATRKMNYRDQHPSFQEDPEFGLYEKERALEESMYEHEPSSFGSRMHDRYEVSHVRDEYGYDIVDEREAYRKRSRSPIVHDQSGKVLYESRHNPRRRNNIEEIDLYDPPSDRLSRSQYVIDDEIDEEDLKSLTRMSRNVMRRIGKPNGLSEPWRGKNRANVAFMKRYGTGHSQFPSSRKSSGSDAKLSHRGPSGVYKDGLHPSLKRRLKMEPSDFEDSFPPSRKQYMSNPYKLQKNGQHVTNELKATGERDLAESSNHVKSDPPEGSEEFKHLTHKAFLKFSKMLNENCHQREKYKEQGKAGSLVCIACGSLSKEFVDTHSLVMHSFNSLKVGLRTDHLGLHKALCVLLGWNCDVPPETSKKYQSASLSEALSLKYDLIVWPPLVVIHNSSIANKSIKGGPKVVSKEGMEDALKDIGFEKGKFLSVCLGNPANNSVLLVKFSPTFSGLREAERLHNYYAMQKRGREELEDVRVRKSSNEAKDVSGLEAKELLFGYMATAEDLDVLDPETKKRCVIKSKKQDIEAIADAPLMAD